MRKRTIGYLMNFSLFIGVLVICAIDVGFLAMLQILAIVIVLVIFINVAAYLINSDKEETA